MKRYTPTELYESQSIPLSHSQNGARFRERAMEYGDAKQICGFDIDGVITSGIHPGPDDVIITGRSYHLSEETYKMLHELGIYNPVYFNPCHRSVSTREESGEWKAQVINSFGGLIDTFFEDDPIQWKQIESRCPHVKVVYILSDLVEK